MKNNLLHKDSLIFTSVILAYLLLVIRFWFVCDDAYISFRYSHNLAVGSGLTYNPAFLTPVEGYSNFLFVLIGALFELVHLPIDLLIPLVSLCSGLALIFSFRNFLKDQGFSLREAHSALLLLALFPPFFIWSSSGMEAVMLSLLLFQSVRYLLFKENLKIACFYGVLLSLVRAEGVFWVIGLAILQIVFSKRSLAIRYLTIVMIVFATYFLWRYSYFGELAPNTVTNKVGFSWEVLQKGLMYAGQYFLTFPSLFLIFPSFFLLPKYFSLRHSLMIVGLVGALLAYPILVGGDFMTMFRFYAPLFPFQVLLLFLVVKIAAQKSMILSRILILMILLTNIIPIFNFHLVPTAIRSKLHLRLNTELFRSEIEQWEFMNFNSARWRELGLALKSISKPGDSLVAGAIGNVGYFSGLTIYDRFGLVEPRVAKRQVRHAKGKSPGHDKAVPAEFFLPDQPTFLKAYLLVGKKIADRDRILKSFARNKAFRDYQGIAYPLERKLNGQDMELVVLKRRDDV